MRRTVLLALLLLPAIAFGRDDDVRTFVQIVKSKEEKQKGLESMAAQAVEKCLEEEGASSLLVGKARAECEKAALGMLERVKVRERRGRVRITARLRKSSLAKEVHKHLPKVPGRWLLAVEAQTQRKGGAMGADAKAAELVRTQITDHLTVRGLKVIAADAKVQAALAKNDFASAAQLSKADGVLRFKVDFQIGPARDRGPYHELKLRRSQASAFELATNAYIGKFSLRADPRYDREYEVGSFGVVHVSFIHPSEDVDSKLEAYAQACGRKLGANMMSRLWKAKSK